MEKQLRKLIRQILSEAVEITPDNELANFDNNVHLTLSNEEQKEYFNLLIKKWKAKKGKMVGQNQFEFMFPVEAKEDLEDIGIFWGEIQSLEIVPGFQQNFVIVDYEN